MLYLLFQEFYTFFLFLSIFSIPFNLSIYLSFYRSIVLSFFFIGAGGKEGKDKDITSLCGIYKGWVYHGFLQDIRDVHYSSSTH